MQKKKRDHIIGILSSPTPPWSITSSLSTTCAADCLQHVQLIIYDICCWLCTQDSNLLLLCRTLNPK
jgi:hypothetical protein